MGMQKFQSVEKTEVVSPEDHKNIAVRLAKVGATTASTLTDEERCQADLLDKNK